MYKIGLSTVAKVISEELFEEYNRAGISAMELSIKKEWNKNLDLKEVRKWSNKHNVALWSYHLPYRPYEMLNLSVKELQESAVYHIGEMIKEVGDIGIDKYIIHSSSPDINDENREERMKCAQESLAKLAEIAKKCGGTVAVENLTAGSLGRKSEEIKKLISLSEDLKVCLDTNHSLAGESTVEFIREIKDKIITVHISDYDLISERHWLPGEGQLDWQEVLKALTEVGYKGPWLYEVAFIPVDTISRNRDLTCEDFVRNAREIFTNSKLTVHGKPAIN